MKQESPLGKQTRRTLARSAALTAAFACGLSAEAVTLMDLSKKSSEQDKAAAMSERAWKAHNARVESQSLTPPGIFGYAQSGQLPKTASYEFSMNAGSLRTISLEPTGEGPVRVTMSWENDSRDLDLRLASPTAGIALPYAASPQGTLFRGANSTLLIERIDAESPLKDREITLTISDRSGAPDGPAQRVLLLISGAKISDQEKQKDELINQSAQEENARRARVEEYLRRKGIPATIESPDGTTREIVDIDSAGNPRWIQTLNAGSATTSLVGKVWRGELHGIPATGKNIPPMGIWDKGVVYADHRELRGRSTIKTAGAAPAVHATHVGGTMVAAGINPNAKGMSFEGKINSYTWNTITAPLTQESLVNGMLLSNHSYGAPLGASVGYDWQSAKYDSLMLKLPYHLGCWAAGNDGRFDNITEVSAAKNVMTVGAIREIAGGYKDRSSVQIWSMSNKGPVPNTPTRVKPDLVAKGENVTSATLGTSDSSVTTLSGTSFATPAVTGILGLMQDYYWQTHHNTYMRSTTLKGLAIHTAGPAGTEGPNTTFGWGVIHAANAADLIGRNNGGGSGFIRELILNNGETQSFSYTGSGSEEIAATIAWLDSAGLQLVRDLDLRVYVDGVEQLPWRLKNGAPHEPAERGDNSADNLERVNTGINKADANVLVKVSHKGTIGSKFIPYSLIISGVKALPSKDLTLISPAAGATLSAAGSAAITWNPSDITDKVRLYWGTAGGEWKLLADSLENKGSYQWNIPDTTLKQVRLRIATVKDEYPAVSGYFSIEKTVLISTARSAGATVFEVFAQATQQNAIDLSLRLPEAGNYRIEILDLAGKTVQRFDGHAETAGMVNQKMQLTSKNSTIASGNYLITGHFSGSSGIRSTLKPTPIHLLRD